MECYTILQSAKFKDGRGFFSETWNKKTLSAQGIEIEFVQDNLSMSIETGTVRGLHCQLPPHGQAKLVRCAQGGLFDVVVDIPRGSPRFGQWIGEELSFENGKQIFIPVGFLHGFVTLEPNTEIMYKCSAFYAPDSDVSVRFDGPGIGIEWPLNRSAVVLSAKDDVGLAWADFSSPFIYEAA